MLRLLAAVWLILQGPWGFAAVLSPAAPDALVVPVERPSSVVLPESPEFEAAVSRLMLLEPEHRPLEEALKAPAQFERAAREVLPALKERPVEGLERIFERRTAYSLPAKDPWEDYRTPPLSRLAYVLADAVGADEVEFELNERRRFRKWTKDSTDSDQTSAVDFDPASRLVVLGGKGTLAAVRLTKGGRLSRKAIWSVKTAGRGYTASVLADSKAGLLASASGSGRVELRRLGPDGPIGKPAILRPFLYEDWGPNRRQTVYALAYDRGSRTLYIGGHGGTVEARRWPKSDGPAVLQSFHAPSGGVLIGASVDEPSRTLLLAFTNGQVEARRIGEGGRAAETPFAKVFVDHREEYRWSSYDPSTRRLLLSSPFGQRLAVVPIGGDGSPSEAVRYLRSEAFTYSGALTGDILISGAFDLATYDLPAERPASLPGAEAWKGAFLGRFKGALAEALAGSSGQVGRILAETIKDSGGLDAPRAAWEGLARPVLDGDPNARLKLLGARWAPRARDELERRMPTLAAALKDPARLGPLLTALGSLRRLYPYSLASAAPMGPMEWALREGLWFPLGELRVFPVSESFRRHIVSTSDGSFAVELKVPGELSGRTTIFGEHYTIARQLEREAPERPSVVRPLYFGRFAGKLSMYGSELHFKLREPLGVFVSEYRDGKRLYNSDGWLPELARRLGRPPALVWLDTLADAAAAAIRLHALGWSGRGDRFTDMHAENVRLTADGRGVLVADFGAMEKRRLTRKQRAGETLTLLGDPDAATREALVPLVIERLESGLARLARGELTP